MSRFFTESWHILKTAAAEWVEDNAAQLGAALAFYSILSLAPLLLISVAIAASVFGPDTARNELMSQLNEMIGEQGAGAISMMLDHAQNPGSGIVATVLGLATLLFGASGVFAQLQTAMNTIWEVPTKKNGGIWATIRSRFLPFAMVLGTGFLLLVSLVLSAVISGIGSYVSDRWPAFEPIGQLANTGVSFLIVTLLFAMIFKLLPDTQIAWRDVWVGALLTALLFTIGKFFIGLYLGKAAVGSAYGAAGSLVVLLIWIYYSAQILFFGAELTQVYARRLGTKSRRGAAAPSPPMEQRSFGAQRSAGGPA
jgi:membrane protein